MNDAAELLDELRAVIVEQQELLRLALYVMTQGPVEYKGERYMCALEEDKVRAAAAVAMGAGQSMNTILRLSTEKGIMVRDLYSIARSVVEGFINAAFFVTQPVDVARRALRHVQFAAWKHQNRVIGTGDFKFTLSNDEDAIAMVNAQFPEFAGKGQGSWTNLNAPSRIERIGKAVPAAAGAFLGAYGMIYAVSSEIIHGSVYGLSYFYGAHSDGKSVESFKSSVQQQLINILSALSHASSGFLAAFGNTGRFGALVLDEHALFLRLYKAATGDNWKGGEPPDK